MKDIQKIYEQKFYIYSYLVDDKQFLTLSYLMCFLQEAAWAHSNNVNVGWSFLQSKNMFWALTKFYLHIERLPKWEEEIFVKTWAKPVELIIHPRDFEVFDSNGNSIIKASSEWVILDRTNFRPQKHVFDDEDRMIASIHAIETKIPKVQKLDLNDASVFNKVLHSDIDMNQHVNNTRYLTWAIDEYDPQFVQNHNIKTCVINFVSQATIGEKYAIKKTEIAPNQFVSTIVSEEGLKELCRIQLNWIENLNINDA